MKLFNKSILYISASLFLIIGLWSVVFYFNMLNEIKESIDEGLDNYKRQIVYKAQNDSVILSQNHFDEGLFTIHKITEQQAVLTKDRYIDTLMYMQDADDEAPEAEPVRLLTTAFKINTNYYELKIINSMVEEDDLVTELFYDALWLYLILISCILIINNVVLQRLWKPFYSFLFQLKNYRIGGHQSFPEVNTQTREFTDLQQAVHTLLQHNTETYEQQKQFIGNAAHELQTPLAIATAKLELLIEKGSLQDDQAESLAEILNIIERMIRLNKSLLLLTKIENKQFLDNQTISVNAIVNQCVSDLQEASEFKQITFSVQEKVNLSVYMDISLANIVVSNLIRNAVFHNVQNGSIQITISEDRILISNTGSGEPLKNDQLFARFQQSKSSQSGTGLGLAIVKAICNLYNYSVSYHFENNLHFFELRFR